MQRKVTKRKHTNRRRRLIATGASRSVFCPAVPEGSSPSGILCTFTSAVFNLSLPPNPRANSPLPNATLIYTPSFSISYTAFLKIRLIDIFNIPASAQQAGQSDSAFTEKNE